MPTIDDLTKKPLEIGEVIIKDTLSINAKVSGAFAVGEILVSTDGAKSFTKLVDLPTQGDFRLGILGDNLTKDQVSRVVLIGVVKKISDVEAAIQAELLKENIFLI